MFKKIYRRFYILYDKQIDASGLAIFRVSFSCVLLFEILQMFYFRHLIFDKIPYLVRGEIEMWPLFLFWILSVLFIIFGLFTRIATIVNYILTTGIFGATSSYEYHMFYSYQIISFLFMFLPISRVFSIDRLLLKLKYSNTNVLYNPSRTVSVLAYYLIILFGIGFVYFDSVFFKLASPLWMKGLGLWLPSSLPQTVFFNISPLLNLKYVVIGLGYITLLFEAIFIFVFWRKKWRVPIMLTGIGLHFGILVCYPIPFFALGMSCIYLLLVPVRYWHKLFYSYQSPKRMLKFFYDAECPICNRTKIILNHLDFRNRIDFLSVQEHAAKEPAFENFSAEILLNDVHSVSQNGKVRTGLDTYILAFNAIWYLKPLSWFLRLAGVYHIGKYIYNYVAINRATERCSQEGCGYVPQVLPKVDAERKIFVNVTLKDFKVKALFTGIIMLIFLQLIVTYNSPLLVDLRDRLRINNVKLIKVSERLAEQIADISRFLLGITHHGLFVDAHFNGYNQVIAVVYKLPSGQEQWLPIFNPDGTPGKYLLGPLWAKWSFRVNGPLINQKELYDGIRDFTAFWAYKHHISLNDAVFEIRIKQNANPKKWEYDFLNKQLQNPWLVVGTAVWRNNEFSPNIKDIEKYNGIQ
ncbi:DCC1-like thiol-disulfide oxidoreductase family protein [Mucilaginibacter sabulilitoris]|uniref:DCC1-like thiol-disulfide oxidoreductase family protein n=1 Tax=Mucilaginibacter sabulilitoris TaxID=1173583 RepID=A0ABZ0TRN2_9SPHI|nr:DCC1-like thiol-disulfide oxidoreductase family protein [Mucilaginibacter sabulilitoris]WPU95786.1 DCC1-like thiol-disulfide oxidoreductase family protein [Mucilaginibacter sabulilitoris]